MPRELMPVHQVTHKICRKSLIANESFAGTCSALATGSGVACWGDGCARRSSSTGMHRSAAGACFRAAFCFRRCPPHSEAVCTFSFLQAHAFVQGAEVCTKKVTGIWTKIREQASDQGSPGLLKCVKATPATHGAGARTSSIWLQVVINKHLQGPCRTRHTYYLGW